MKVLVTGGAGFIGAHVVESLLKRGDEVVIVDNLNSYYSSQLKRDRLDHFCRGVEFYEVDITDYDTLREVFYHHKFDAICHLAAQAGVRYSVENPMRYNQTNGLGTIHILELAKSFGIKDIVIASSSSVYGENEKVPFSEKDRVDLPVSVYAASKRYKELLARVYSKMYEMNISCLRFFTVYGPWGRPDMAYWGFTEKILSGREIDVYNQGNLSRDFTYISDITRGVVHALDRVEGFAIYNLGGDRVVGLLDFIKALETALGREARKNFVGMQKGDVPTTMADISMVREMFGWEPTVRVEEGLQEFAQWYHNYKKGITKEVELQ